MIKLYQKLFCGVAGRVIKQFLTAKTLFPMKSIPALCAELSIGYFLRRCTECGISKNHWG
jgi:hypothetical protein